MQQYTPGELATISEYQSSVNKDAGWFFFIGGLSIINTVLIHTGAGLSFVVGLTITQFIDAFGIGMVQATQTESAVQIIPIITSILSVGISLLFLLFGWFGRKCMRIPFLIGIILYILDSLLLALFPSVLSIIFHIVAIIFLFRGWKTIGMIKEIRDNPSNMFPQVDPVLEADPS